jgi:uncharacterized membrane protein YkoI
MTYWRRPPALTFSAAAQAEEKKITEAEVPRAVIEKVKKKYPAAKMTAFELETERGKASYEVKIIDGAKQLEVVCAPDGQILAEEEKIGIDAVPEKVRQALKSSPKYASWKLQHAERVITGEKVDAPIYEIKVTNGNVRAELVFTPDGKLTHSEEEPWHEKR